MWILCNLCMFVSFAVSAYGQNDVRKPPSITKGPETKVIFRENQEVTLTCKAEGIPAVTYIWKRNDEYLNLNNPNVSRGLDGDITIISTTLKDDGFYQCFTTNQYGTAISTVAHIQMAFLIRVSQSNIIVNMTVPEGLPFVIAAVRLKSFPTPMYKWVIKKSNDDSHPTQFDQSRRVHSAHNGDLYFAYVLKDDELNGSIYSSSVFNAYADVIVGGSYTRIMVTQGSGDPPDFSPNITHFSKSQDVALIGGKIELECIFSGKPLPNITWSRLGNNLPSGRNNITNFATNLTISNIMESDGGDYVCTATNTIGTFNQTLNFRVEAVPIFKRESDCLRNVNVTEGESITFNCSAFAKPEATVVWLRNGQPIDVTKAPERFVFSNDSGSLTIRDVCRDCVNQERQTDLMVIQCNASNVHGYAFASGYLNVIQTYCSIELDIGRTISQPCPGNATGRCSRKCLLGSNAKASWGEPNCNGCFHKEFRELLDKVNTLSADALQNQTVMAEIARQLSVVTNKNDGMSPGNLNASIMIINRLAVLRRNNTYIPNEEEIKCIVQAVSNILQPNNSKAWKELIHVNTHLASFILHTFDVYGRSLYTLNITGHTILEKDHLFLEAWLFDKSNLRPRIEFPDRSGWGENRGVGISVSTEALNSSILWESQSTLTMYGVYYRTIHEHLPGHKDFGDVNSRILAFTIAELTTNDTLNPPVLITLRHNKEKRRSFQRTCAFWNFDRNGWDSTGCSVTSTNSTHTICSCDHLTNFAILMSLKPLEDKWLSIISVIGCSISVAALILTIIVYAFTWKQAKSTQATLLLNLCVALIIAYIIFLTGADKFDSNVYSEDACTAVAVLLHYFFLAAFFIMLAEGIDMVLYIFFVFHVRKTIETIMLVATAWVLPLIIVGISLGSTKLEGYGHEAACWLSTENGLIWAFVGPILCIITVNCVILVVVLRLVSQKRDLLAKDRKKSDDIRATIWNLLITCPVLGLGWLFGTLSVSFDHDVFQYLFVIANSLQGLLIFIFHALFHNKKMNEKISSVYSRYICRTRKTYTQMISAQEQSTSSRATTQTSSAQDQSTCSIAANDSSEAIPMTPAPQQSTSPRAATQMASAQEKSTGSIAANQMNLAEEVSTISIAATQMASAQEKSTGSIAATQLNLAQEQSTISIAATPMASAQEKSTISIAATQMASAQEKSTGSIAATQMNLAQEQSTISIAASQMASAQEKSTGSIAATQLNLAQEQSTSSRAATQMASAQEKSTGSIAATQMTSAQEQSTSSGAANKKSHKTGFLGVPTAFKFCEEIGSQHNLKRTGTQLMSTEDSDTFESTH